ncbi:MAG: hypothetical protein ABIJ96_15000 [Elusimicrobiota bacterium]
MRYAALFVVVACGVASARPPAGNGVELLDISAGTLLSVELVDPIHTGKNAVGDVFRCRILEGVWSKNRVVIAPGTTVRGELTEVERSGRISKRAKLALTLNSVQVDGSTIPLHTDTLSYVGDKHAGKNTGSLLSGALQGVFFGLLFGGKTGAGVGAAAGAGAGAVSGLIKGKQDIEFVQGANLLFETTQKITVPVYPEAPKKDEKAVKPSS